MKTDNIILIGMPGAGKSTVGVVLAKKCGCRFLDSDLVIQEQQGALLHELIERFGTDGFLEIENQVNASLQIHKTILATGGSAVYGNEAMAHLKSIGRVVYLQLSYEQIEQRLGDLNERGVALKDGQSLHDLYEERIPLYERYADLTIPCDGRSIREIVTEIVTRVR
ncbi:MAG: shikimate kinase [Lachnospiraceae bacterium]|nr:shikimate kinase [Lachnospiraceae bacterium]